MGGLAEDGSHDLLWDLCQCSCICLLVLVLGTVRPARVFGAGAWYIARPSCLASGLSFYFSHHGGGHGSFTEDLVGQGRGRKTADLENDRVQAGHGYVCI